MRAMEGEISDLQQRVAAREAEIEAQACRISELEQRLDRAHEDGLAEGRRAGIVLGLERAQRDDRERTAAVSAAADNALRSFEEALTQVGELAEHIALAALEQVAGDPSARKGLVAAIVARQLDRLRDAAPLRVRVASADFSSADELRDALPEAAAGSVEFVLSDELCSGEVRVELKLGQVDAGLNRQIAALRTLLLGDSRAA